MPFATLNTSLYVNTVQQGNFDKSSFTLMNCFDTLLSCLTIKVLICGILIG